MHRMSNRLVAAAAVAVLLGSAAAQAATWDEEIRTAKWTIDHCDASPQAGCPVEYVTTWIAYRGYFSSQLEAASACKEKLNGAPCQVASGEPGPPLEWGGWVETCPGGINKYGRCVSQLFRLVGAYFPTVVVEQDIERPQDCSSKSREFGNPIDGLTGEKRETIKLLPWSPAAPALQLTYRSGRFARQSGKPSLPGNNIPGFPVAGGSVGSGIPDGGGSNPFGPLWSHGLDSRITLTHQTVRLSRLPGGGGLSFVGKFDGSAMRSTSGQADRLHYLGGAGGAHWLHRDPRHKRSQYFSASGMLIHAVNADGTDRQWLTYSDSSTPRTEAAGPDRLLSIRDASGRQLRVSYLRNTSNLATDLIAALTDAQGSSTRFEYDSARRLSAVRWPDGSMQRFTYDPALPWALTARLDELGVAIGNWTWDITTGLVRSTAGADAVNLHQLRFAQAPGIHVTEALEGSILRRRYVWQAGSAGTVTRPNGASVTLAPSAFPGQMQVVQRSQPAGAGCEASVQSTVLDANGNPVVRDDFDGSRSCHAYDMDRNLELARVEGLDRSANCTALLLEGAALPAGARKITTRWHPVWPLAERVAGPGRLEARVYNSRPDPSDGTATVSCMPPATGGDRPSDIEPAALCRRIELGTLDTNGSQGLQAAPDPGAAARVERWTYNRQGQPLSHDGPRNDVADMTFWHYHPMTTADVRAGDLAEMRNAIGHSTRFHRWTPTGQLVSFTDANNVRTDLGYDIRQNLLARTEAVGTLWERRTNHEWDARGLLRATSLPSVAVSIGGSPASMDAQTIHYVYDRAHRLVSQFGAAGRGMSRQLDLNGKVMAQTVHPGGTSPSMSTRWDYDALDRPWREWTSIHGVPRATTFAYDAVGRPTLVQPPAVQDNLEGSAPQKRLKYDRLGNLSSIEYTGLLVPQTLSLAHDLLGRPTSVVSIRGARFTFGLDGLSQRQEDLGPDTGRTVRRLDESGNLIATTDAGGTVTLHRYDALNRRIATTRRAVDNSDIEELRYTWDTNPGAALQCSHGAGRLCRIDDAAGTRHFAYDPFGRLIEQWTIELGQTHRQTFAWDPQGRLLGSTDGGGALSFWRDGDGGIKAVRATVGGAPTTLLIRNGVRLDGGASSTWLSNGVNVIRKYDTSGKLLNQADNSRAIR